MKEFIRYIKKLSMLVVLSPLKLLKTKENRVLLDNCLAHNFADNIKPIALYLSENYPNVFDVNISVGDIAKYDYLTDRGFKLVKFHSLKYYIIAMTSKFFITNSGGYSYLPLKNDQVVINTWHGGGAYKKIGIDSFGASKFYRYDLKLAAKKTTLFTATGSRFADLISRALLIPRHIFVEVGMPRNDILVNGNEEIVKKVRKSIGLKDNERFVLYAPTYRRINDDSFGKSVAITYGIDSERVCKSLSKRFGGSWRFAVRLHPQISKTVNEFENIDVIDLTGYDDMQELLLAADVMINDFSSSMWDYMLTGKPSFLYAKDLQHYIDTTAVYTPVEEWPFPKSTSNDELEKTILEFDEELYKEKCKYHYKQLGGSETGEATKFVCKYMIDLMGK